jgi:hypothetical protein
MRHSLVLILALYACAGSDSNPEALNPDLVGRWVGEPDSWSACRNELTFSDEGIYLDEYACRSGENAFDVQTTTGRWHTNEATLTLDPVESSCPELSSAPAKLDVVFLNDMQRALLSDFGGLRLAPVDQDAGTIDELFSGIRRDGCFDAQRDFSEHPVQTL